MPTLAKPSTASVSWLWNEVRRISPSVTTSSPAASCAATASSTASSSTRLNSACEIVPAARASRAASSARGRSMLPTTSVWGWVFMAGVLHGG